MKRLLAAVLFAISLVSSGMAQTEGFKTYKSSDGRFQVSGPGDPVKITKTIQNQGVSFEFINYEFNYNAEQFVVADSLLAPEVASALKVGSQEIRRELSRRFFEGIEKTLAGGFGKMGTAKTTRSEINLDSVYPFLFLEVEITRKDGTVSLFWGKFLLAKGHSFSLTVFSKTGRGPSEIRAVAFFNSFKVMEEESPKESTGTPPA